jgi:hypothetical protein
VGYIVAFIKVLIGRVPVAHACNPSYPGGRDQENCGSKPAWANSSQDPISKKPFIKRAGRVAQGENPEFKSQYHKKKKKFLQYIKYIILEFTPPPPDHFPSSPPFPKSSILDF